MESLYQPEAAFLGTDDSTPIEFIPNWFNCSVSASRYTLLVE